MNKLLKISPYKPTGFLMTDSASLLNAGSLSIGAACVDSSGIFYFSDSSVHAIFSIDTMGRVALFAGVPGEIGNNGGPLKQARFNAPAGLAVDQSGAIYVADSGNHRIRVIKNNKVFTLFGSSKGFSNGSPSNAKLNRPSDVCIDSAGIVFVADTGNHSIRLFNGQYLSTLAGDGEPGDSLGIGRLAKFKGPLGITVDLSGRVYVADTGNRKVKVIDPSLGNVWHFCGSGQEGDQLGNPNITSFRELREIFVDKSGVIFALSRTTDTGVGRVVRIGGNGFSAGLSQLENSDMDEINGLAVSLDDSVYVSISGDVGLQSSESSQSNDISSISSSISSSGSSVSSGSSKSSSSRGVSFSSLSSGSSDSSISTSSSRGSSFSSSSTRRLTSSVSSPSTDTDSSKSEDSRRSVSSSKSTSSRGSSNSSSSGGSSFSSSSDSSSLNSSSSTESSSMGSSLSSISAETASSKSESSKSGTSRSTSSSSRGSSFSSESSSISSGGSSNSSGSSESSSSKSSISSSSESSRSSPSSRGSSISSESSESSSSSSGVGKLRVTLYDFDETLQRIEIGSFVSDENLSVGDDVIFTFTGATFPAATVKQLKFTSDLPVHGCQTNGRIKVGLNNGVQDAVYDDWGGVIYYTVEYFTPSTSMSYIQINVCLDPEMSTSASSASSSTISTSTKFMKSSSSLSSKSSDSSYSSKSSQSSGGSSNSSVSSPSSIPSASSESSRGSSMSSISSESSSSVSSESSSSEIGKLRVTLYDFNESFQRVTIGSFVSDENLSTGNGVIFTFTGATFPAATVKQLKFTSDLPVHGCQTNGLIKVGLDSTEVDAAYDNWDGVVYYTTEFISPSTSMPYIKINVC